MLRIPYNRWPELLNRLGHLGIIIKIIPVSKLPVLILLIFPGVLDVCLLFRFQKDLVRIDQTKFFLRCLFYVPVCLDVETFLLKFRSPFLFRRDLFDQDAFPLLVHFLFPTQ